MEDSIDYRIKEILTSLNHINKTYLVGGYLRNLYLGRKVTDVDFITNLTLEELKTVIPNIKYTDTGIAFGICKSVYNGLPIDFKIISDGETFERALFNRDFTINSLYYDGEKVYFPGTSKFDLDHKLLKPCYCLDTHFETSPNTAIRAYRFISELGFEPSEEILSFLSKHKNETFNPDNFLFVEELKKTIKGDYVAKSIYFMNRTYSVIDNDFSHLKNILIPLYNENLNARLFYLDLLFNYSLIDKLVAVWGENKYFDLDTELYRTYLNNPTTIPKQLFPFFLLIKRYQTNDDKNELSKFIQLTKGI